MDGENNSVHEVAVIEKKYRRSKVAGWCVAGVGAGIILTGALLMWRGGATPGMLMLTSSGVFCAAFGIFILRLAAVLRKNIKDYKNLLEVERKQLERLEEEDCGCS